jgi:hypothetical protein
MDGNSNRRWFCSSALHQVNVCCASSMPSLPADPCAAVQPLWPPCSLSNALLYTWSCMSQGADVQTRVHLPRHIKPVQHALRAQLGMCQACCSTCLCSSRSPAAPAAPPCPHQPHCTKRSAAWWQQPAPWHQRPSGPRAAELHAAPACNSRALNHRVATCSARHRVRSVTVTMCHCVALL